MIHAALAVLHLDGDLVGSELRYDLETETIVGSFDVPQDAWPVPVSVDNLGNIYTSDSATGLGESEGGSTTATSGMEATSASGSETGYGLQRARQPRRRDVLWVGVVDHPVVAELDEGRDADTLAFVQSFTHPLFNETTYNLR